jgi:hypothetical protein
MLPVNPDGSVSADYEKLAALIGVYPHTTYTLS